MNDKTPEQEIDLLAKRYLEEAGGDEVKAKELLRAAIASDPRLKEAAVHIAAKSMLEEVGKDYFAERRKAALDEIRTHLAPWKTVAECLTETQVAEIFRKHGFTSPEDIVIQEHEAFPRDRKQ